MAKAKARIVWQPQPKQARALACPVPELFFGGAAGGGKSDFLLADFLRGIEHGPEHVGIMFRKTYPQLEELIRRSHDIYRPMGAEYKTAEHVWTFPGGALLRFRHLEADMGVHDYQGHAFTWIGWDELTNWATDYPYIWLFSRLRSATGRPCRVRSAANPGGLGHGWVKQRFIEIGPPETIYMDPETQIKRVFIPAHLEDNIALMASDPDYEKRLQALYPQLYRAYRFGDWDILSGQVFEEFRAEEHMVPAFPVDPGWFRFASLDWGYAKPFSIGWWAIDHDGRMIRYREWYGCEKGKHNVGVKMPVKDVARRAWKWSVAEGCSDMVADPSCWNKQGLEGNCIAEEFASAGWQMEPAINDRIGGWSKMHDLLKLRGSDGRPMMLAFDTCTAFRRIIPVLVADERHPEDVDCWIAGTMVSTPKGDQRIEDIVEGDIVDTPIGPKRVVKSYVSGDSPTVWAELSNGQRIEGTARHKIYVRGRGLVPLSDVHCHDILSERIKPWQRKLLSIAVSLTHAMRAVFTTTRTVHVWRTEGHPCIGNSGLTLDTKSPRVGIFIILIMTMTTILSKILNVFLPGNIVRCTSWNNSAKNWETSSGNGENQIKASKPSERMRQKCVRIPHDVHVRADIVNVLLKREVLCKSIVLMNVLKKPITDRLKNSVLFAGLRSGQNITQRKKQKPVHIIAVGSCADAKPVFNLTVANAHLFYANGILSSNTKQEDHLADEVRYACMSPLSKRTSRPDTRKLPGGDAEKDYDPLRWGMED